jgi:hypothetical protein
MMKNIVLSSRFYVCKMKKLKINPKKVGFKLRFGILGLIFLMLILEVST